MKEVKIMFKKLMAKYKENKDICDICIYSIAVIATVGIGCYSCGKIDGYRRGVETLAALASAVDKIKA